jgi:hypothetical protein
MPSLDKEYIEDYLNTKFQMFFEEIDFGRLEFLDSVDIIIKQMQELGISDDEIVKNLYNEMVNNNGLVKLQNKEANSLWDFFKSTSQYTVWSSLDDNTLYRWTMTPGVEHCNVCSELNGQVKTLEKWEQEGLPGNRNAGCYANCLCDLIEVEKE